MRRLATNEGGFSLVEMLIAMVVMSIGIAALVAGFSSGILSVTRAGTTSTAGTLADRQMEQFRQAAFTSLPIGAGSPTPLPGGDGRTYSMQVDGTWTCAVGTYSAGPPASCSGTPTSRPVKVITITVRDASATKLLFTESATFDSSTG